MQVRFILSLLWVQQCVVYDWMVASNFQSSESGAELESMTDASKIRSIPQHEWQIIGIIFSSSPAAEPKPSTVRPPAMMNFSHRINRVGLNDAHQVVKLKNSESVSDSLVNSISWDSPDPCEFVFFLRNSSISSIFPGYFGMVMFRECRRLVAEEGPWLGSSWEKAHRAPKERLEGED